MQVTLSIPDFALLTLNRDLRELKQMIKTNSALMLYKNGKFSIEQASRFAGLSLYDFMAECKKNEISIIDYAEGELEHEMEMLRSL